MSLAELVFAYATVAIVLIAAMVAVAIKEKAKGKAIFARANWNFLLALRPRKMLTGEIWLTLLLAAFITLCAGVIIVVFILPYGIIWTAAAVLITISALFTLMARPLK
jgi:hypothetical protein